MSAAASGEDDWSRENVAGKNTGVFNFGMLRGSFWGCHLQRGGHGTERPTGGVHNGNWTSGFAGAGKFVNSFWRTIAKKQER